jgi:hypothetical protein
MKRKYILVLMILGIYFFGINDRLVLAQKGPIKHYLQTDRDLFTTTNLLMDPMFQDLFDYLEENALVYDLMNPLRAEDTDKHVVSPIYFTNTHEVVRNVNPDCYLSEYANVRNWAGNIFGRETLPEEWYLHDPYNILDRYHRVITPYSSAYNSDINAHNEWVYDMGNSDFVDFFAARVVEALSNGLDAVEMDNAGIKEYLWLVRIWADGDNWEYTRPQNPRTGKNYTIAEQHVEYINMSKKVREAVDKAFPSGLSFTGKKIYLIANIGKEIIDEEWELVRNYGGVLSEGGGWFAHRDGPLEFEVWKDQLDSLRKGMNEGIYWIDRYKRYIGSEPWPGRSRQLFKYGSVLLGTGKIGDNYHSKNDADWGGYGVYIGYAQGDYYLYPGTDHIYARNYDQGLVLVNPLDTNETVEPDFSYQRFLDSGGNEADWDGLSSQMSGPLTVRAYEAEILLREGNGIDKLKLLEIMQDWLLLGNSQSDQNNDDKVNAMDLSWVLEGF